MCMSLKAYFFRYVKWEKLKVLRESITRHLEFARLIISLQSNGQSDWTSMMATFPLLGRQPSKPVNHLSLIPINPRITVMYLEIQTTRNNREMIGGTRSYIFRGCSRCRRRGPLLSPFNVETERLHSIACQFLIQQGSMKAGSNGTTKIQKTTTWPVENFLTGHIAKTLSCIFVADQMGQRTHLSNCPCAYRFFCWNTPATARLLWACAWSKSGCSGIVRTKKIKTTGLENYRNLCLQKTSNAFSVTISKCKVFVEKGSTITKLGRLALDAFYIYCPGHQISSQKIKNVF